MVLFPSLLMQGAMKNVEKHKKYPDQKNTVKDRYLSPAVQ